MKNEQEHPSYKPSTKKEHKLGRGEYNQEEYLKNLEKAMENEQKNSGYKPSTIKNDQNNNDFYEKLEKEIEKDKEHPYVPYKDMKKNNNM